MNEKALTPLLAQMTDGYARWQDKDRRRRRRRRVAIVATALLLTVTVDATAFSLPQRYSSFAGGYGPDAVPVVDQLLSWK